MSRLDELEARMTALESKQVPADIEELRSTILGVRTDLEAMAADRPIDYRDAFSRLVSDVDDILRRELGVGLDTRRILRAVS